jgi:hypothetical protein
LQQVDFDGKASFSDIVPVTMQSRLGKLSVYPNPVVAGTDCTVTHPFGDQSTTTLSLRLLDITGRQVAILPATQRLPTADLKPGIYWLEVRSALGNSVEKIVVQ